MQVTKCEDIYNFLVQAVNDDLEFWKAGTDDPNGTNRFVS